MWDDKPNIQVIILIAIFSFLLLAITNYFWSKAEYLDKKAKLLSHPCNCNKLTDAEIIDYLEEINRKLSNIQTNEVV